MSARPPSIKRTRVSVTAEAGKVAPVGTLELDLIESREHAAWMQQVADLIASGASGLSAVEVRVTALDGSVSTLSTRLGEVEQAIADSGSAVAVGLELDAHKADTGNPHATTAAQVDADPSGTAATAVAEHAEDTSTHGVTTVVGAVETQTLSNKTLDATNKFGGAANYTMFEADGTPVAVGDATTYDDSQAAVIYMRAGGTALTLDVLAGGIYAYRFDQTDEIHSQIQTTHRYKTASAIDFHIHLVNKAAVGATAYNVGVEVEWGWAGLNGVMPAPTVEPTVDCSFQNAAALTHKVFELKVITPTAAQGTISSILFFRVKRVAASTENLAGNNIFIAGVDFHTQNDTPGSREEYIK